MVLTLPALILAACASSVALRPANPQAKAAGAMRAWFPRSWQAEGPARIRTADGRLLSGRLTQVHGPPGAFYSPDANAQDPIILSDAPAILTATGSGGVTMRCEINKGRGRREGHGVGGCKSSDGGEFELSY